MPSLRLRESPPVEEDSPSESEPRRPESGFPEGEAVDRDDRILAAVAAMAVGYARTGDLDAARYAVEEGLFRIGGVTDPALLARASVDLGEALLALEDPTCRALLEDAGTLFEDLGDQEAVRRVDTLLRAAEASIEESPRSFVARPPRG